MRLLFVSYFYRRRFNQFMLAFTLMSSGLACIEPSVNHVFMFVMAVPATVLMIMELRMYVKHMCV